MKQIEGYITWILWWMEALENEGQRVLILYSMKIFIERMVGRSRHARQAHPSRQHITYTRCVRHPPDEAGYFQPVARRTHHRENEEEAGPSHTEPHYQTTLARGRDRGRGRGRGIRLHYLVCIIEILVLI